jgi:hypothetical protein
MYVLSVQNPASLSSKLLKVRMFTGNTNAIIFIQLIGIICVTGSINYHEQNWTMIPVVINTWPFTNATQNGKNNHVL